MGVLGIMEGCLTCVLSMFPAMFKLFKGWGPEFLHIGCFLLGVSSVFRIFQW